MKKILFLLVFIFSVSALTSCTDVEQEHEIIQELHATDKEDNCNSTGCGQGGVEEEDEDPEGEG